MSLAVEIQKRYLKEEYNKKTPDAVQLTLHYLLALNQPDSVIVAYIDRQKTPLSCRLTAPDPKCFSWTPLIVATILNRSSVVSALLATDARGTINHADSNHWTALHHAAAVSNEIFRALLAAGANTQLQTALFATPRDIQLLTDRASQEDPQAFLVTQETTSKISSLSSQRLQELFQMSLWRTTPFYPPESIKILWQSLPKERQMNSLLKAAFKNFKENPPTLHIKKEPNLENHWGLFAGQEIEEGCVISEYTGTCINPLTSYPRGMTLLERIALHKEASAYYLRPYDAKTVGNACRFANSGWPNAVMDDVVADGASRGILIAGEKILKNSPIYWDYGITSIEITLGVQKILGEQEMLLYYENGLEGAMQKLQSFETRFSGALAMQRLLFPLNCPVALLKLHLKGRVFAQQWQQLLFQPDENELIKDWCTENQDMSQIVRSIISRIVEFDEFVQTHTSPDAIKMWLENCIGKMSLVHILKGMELIRARCDDLEQVEQQLQTYDPVTDHNGPLSVNRRSEDYRKLLLCHCSKEKTRAIIMQNM